MFSALLAGIAGAQLYLQLGGAALSTLQQLMDADMLVLGASSFSLVGPNTASSCQLRIWWFNLSFTLMFAFLFIKVP